MNATISNGTRYWRHLYDETLIFIFDRVRWYCCWLLLWLVARLRADVSMSFVLNLQRNCGTDSSIISLMMLWFAYIYFAQFILFSSLTFFFNHTDFLLTEHHFQFSMHILLGFQFVSQNSSPFMNIFLLYRFFSSLLLIHSYKYHPFYERKNKKMKYDFNLIKNPLNEFLRDDLIYIFHLLPLFFHSIFPHEIFSNGIQFSIIKRIIERSTFISWWGQH